MVMLHLDQGKFFLSCPLAGVAAGEEDPEVHVGGQELRLNAGRSSRNVLWPQNAVRVFHGFQGRQVWLTERRNDRGRGKRCS